MTKHQRATILLIDNESAPTFKMSETLEKLGYQVIVVESCESALRTYIGGREVDLILIDIDCAASMNRHEAGKQILVQDTIPIVFQLVEYNGEIIKQVRDITRYGCVLKDSDEFVLQTTIDTALRSFEAQRQLEIEKGNRIQSDKTLRQYKARYESLNENCADFTAIVDLNGAFIYASHSTKYTEWGGVAIGVGGSFGVSVPFGVPNVYGEVRAVSMSWSPAKWKDENSTMTREGEYKKKVPNDLTSSMMPEPPQPSHPFGSLGFVIGVMLHL